jgi:hypothetical protein
VCFIIHIKFLKIESDRRSVPLHDPYVVPPPHHSLSRPLLSPPPLLLNFVGITVGGRGKATDYVVSRPGGKGTKAFCGAHETITGRHTLRGQCIMCHPLTTSKRWAKTFDVQAFLPGAATAGM